MAQPAQPAGFPQEAPLPLSEGSRRIVIAGAMLALFLAAIDQTIVATAVPRIVSDLGGLDLLAWVFSSYMLASTIVVPLAGKLGDQFGRKPLFLVGIVLFIVGSVLAGAAQTMLELVLVRALQGMGAGMIFATTFAVVGDLYSPLERGRVQGAFAGVFGIASVIGPTLGGWITDTSTWRWVFLVNLPVGIIAFAVVLIGMPTVTAREGARPKLDLLGAALLVVALVPLLLATIWAGERYPWGSIEIIGLFALSATGVALFLLQETRAAEPILPLSLFRDRTFSTSAPALFLLGAGMFDAITMVPLFLQGVLGVSARLSGTLMTPMMLSIVTGAAIGGQVMSRTGRYRVLLLSGIAVMTVGMALFSTIDAGMGRYDLIPFMVITGLGLGVTLPLFNVIVQNALPFHQLGVATASVQFFRQIGGTVGVAVLTGVMVNRFRDGLADLGGTAGAVIDNPNALLNEQEVEELRETYEATAQAGDAPFDVVLELARAPLADAIGFVFLIGAVVVVLAFAVTLFLPELKLREVSPAEVAREAAAARAAERDGAATAAAAPPGAVRH